MTQTTITVAAVSVDDKLVHFTYYSSYNKDFTKRANASAICLSVDSLGDTSNRTILVAAPPGIGGKGKPSHFRVVVDNNTIRPPSVPSWTAEPLTADKLEVVENLLLKFSVDEGVDWREFEVLTAAHFAKQLTTNAIVSPRARVDWKKPLVDDPAFNTTGNIVILNASGASYADIIVVVREHKMMLLVQCKHGGAVTKKTSINELRKMGFYTTVDEQSNELFKYGVNNKKNAFAEKTTVPLTTALLKKFGCTTAVPVFAYPKSTRLVSPQYLWHGDQLDVKNLVASITTSKVVEEDDDDDDVEDDATSEETKRRINFRRRAIEAMLEAIEGLAETQEENDELSKLANEVEKLNK